MDKVREFYPHAMSVREFIPKAYEVMREADVDPKNVLVAQSICSDDINSIQYPSEIRQTLGPFYLGGLGGYPCAGLTAMDAFAHHVPEQGAPCIFYGPHIGIGEREEIGNIWRPGQSHPTTCCGAVIHALQKLERNEISGTDEEDPLDHQAQTLEQILLKSADRIRQSKNHLLEAVEVLLEASGDMINKLIARTDYHRRHLFVFGGVIINSDGQSQAIVEVRRCDTYDFEKRSVLSSIGTFQ